MNLLIITNNPKRASFRQRIGIYIDSLRSAGINCTVAKLPSNLIKRFFLFKKATNFDAVFLHKKCLNLFDLNCLRHYSKKIIYDFDDAIMYSPHKPENNKNSHYRIFRRTVKSVDMIIAGNDYLAKQAREFNHNVHILPTGLDTKAYDIPINFKQDNKVTLVWIGSKETLKYLCQIKPALEHIGKTYPNVVLKIISDSFFDLNNMSVEKVTWSQNSQHSDLATSDIGLAPLPDDRFTRGKCGFKILQYQAAQLPCVASPVGVNTDFVTDNLTGFVASDNSQWIDKLSQLIQDPALRKQMGQNAKNQVQKYDYTKIGLQLSQLIDRSLNGIPIISTNNDPIVSICIPTFNRKKYLKETLDSIFAQTYKNYEIIIVDDGSTDGTEEMIKQIDFPIKYHWQQNAGDAAARNKLIELAKGDFISFIDSDDLLMPDALENMVKVLQGQHPDTIVYGSYYRIDHDGNIYGKCNRKLYSGYITEHLFKTILVHACGSMFPAKILKQHRFDTSLKVCSDYALWLKLSIKYPFKALENPTFKRRRHLNNLSAPTFKNCLTEFKVLKDFYYLKGGKDFISEKIANKILAKEAIRSGRSALSERSYDQAHGLFKESFRLRPSVKTLFYLLKTSLYFRVSS